MQCQRTCHWPKVDGGTTYPGAGSCCPLTGVTHTQYGPTGCVAPARGTTMGDACVRPGAPLAACRAAARLIGIEDACRSVPADICPAFRRLLVRLPLQRRSWAELCGRLRGGASWGGRHEVWDATVGIPPALQLPLQERFSERLPVRSRGAPWRSPIAATPDDSAITSSFTCRCK